MSTIDIPDLCLVVLIGPSGCGKSSFAARHFLPTEVLSSDACRGMVSDDENDQSVTADAFEILRFIGGKRLAAGRLTVVDATNVQPASRKSLIQLARTYDVLPVAIVLDVPPKVCHARNASRDDRNFGSHVVRQQASQLSKSLRGLKREGFRKIHILKGENQIDAVTIERTPQWNDRKHLAGPFDIIGDVHGCYGELVQLLETLGWELGGQPDAPTAHHPDGRTAVFVGDLVDRGPASPQVLKLVMAMCAAGVAHCVPGNHDVKLLRKLDGRDVRLTHGLAETLAQLESETDEFRESARTFIRRLVSHLVFDDGRLVVAHAGMKEAYQGRASGRVREFALYGETTGETDEFGLPVRLDWASQYRGAATVVYGHTPMPEAHWVNRTICIDTGCVFGGKLTALLYPERELVEVPAEQEWYQPVRPLASDADRDESRGSQVLDIDDVIGKRVVTTRIQGRVTIQEENAAAALEVMSRFATDPRWLIYLPPTMSPTATCKEGPLLEHPREVFGYYRHQGVHRVVCEEKHMGSRAVVVVCRDTDTAAARFADDGRLGVVYTRTGRPFFNDPAMEAAVVERVAAAIAAAGWWERFETDWVCLDCELMPWSAKAQDLLRTQYAAVGAAGSAGLAAAQSLLQTTTSDGAAALLDRVRSRRERVERFQVAYRHYCWPVVELTDLRLAPFHVMATEGTVHTGHDHAWHMQTLAELCQHDLDLLFATQTREVNVTEPDSEQAAIAWWEEMTRTGGEGMVVKSADWLVRGRKGLVQPAVKCRGPEYLRIIYGPEYDAPEHLERLRGRGLGRKRSLAIREYALGLEALHRFVEHEPLYRVHQCVFGVLALESEPVDPRL